MLKTSISAKNKNVKSKYKMSGNLARPMLISITCWANTRFGLMFSDQKKKLSNKVDLFM